MKTMFCFYVDVYLYNKYWSTVLLLITATSFSIGQSDNFLHAGKTIFSFESNWKYPVLQYVCLKRSADHRLETTVLNQLLSKWSSAEGQKNAFLHIHYYIITVNTQNNCFMILNNSIGYIVVFLKLLYHSSMFQIHFIKLQLLKLIVKIRQLRVSSIVCKSHKKFQKIKQNRNIASQCTLPSMLQICFRIYLKMIQKP